MDNLNESIRFVATEHDRLLLEQIAKEDGDASMSATLRRLIRTEASRRNIEPIPTYQNGGVNG